MQINNHNVELDFADEIDEEPSQIDEYSTPVERQANDPVIKVSSKPIEGYSEKTTVRIIVYFYRNHLIE